MELLLHADAKTLKDTKLQTALDLSLAMFKINVQIMHVKTRAKVFLSFLLHFNIFFSESRSKQTLCFDFFSVKLPSLGLANKLSCENSFSQVIISLDLRKRNPKTQEEAFWIIESIFQFIVFKLLIHLVTI